jgi:hypothetical protein
MSGLYFFAGGGAAAGGGCAVVVCSVRHGTCRSEVQAASTSTTSAKATEILCQPLHGRARRRRIMRKKDRPQVLGSRLALCAMRLRAGLTHSLGRGSAATAGAATAVRTHDGLAIVPAGPGSKKWLVAVSR